MKNRKCEHTEQGEVVLCQDFFKHFEHIKMKSSSINISKMTTKGGRTKKPRLLVHVLFTYIMGQTQMSWWSSLFQHRSLLRRPKKTVARSNQIWLDWTIVMTFGPFRSDPTCQLVSLRVRSDRNLWSGLLFQDKENRKGDCSKLTHYMFWFTGKNGLEDGKIYAKFNQQCMVYSQL